MKKFLITLAMLTGVGAAFAYSYDTNLPLAGGSIADKQLQNKTLFTAYMFAHRVATPDCQTFAITDTRVVEEKVDNKWQEIWTIDACTKQAEVPITFIDKGADSVYAIDPMGVKVITKE
ncbi:MAG: hypothetical protein E7Z89_01580 [Cyanobacteria bacterium SIG28]|nr:hypothetical protein [Cyanobacteria bacterium SIG28]